MTISAVQEFLTKVGEDQSLQAELTQALEGGNERQAVTKLGQSKGYEFSSEELMAEVQKRQAAAEQADQLSDDDLEAVAGGVTPTITVASAAAGFASAGFTMGKGW